MKTISSFIIFLTIFFLATTSIIFIVDDIGIKNQNLDDTSRTMLNNLSSYKNTQSNYEFSKVDINYSMTGYEDVDAFDKDNSESKGTIETFFFLGDTFIIIPLFANIILPIEISLLGWALSFLVVVLGYFFVIAIYNAWKGKRV